MVTLKSLQLQFLDVGKSKIHAVDVKENEYYTICGQRIVQHSRVGTDILENDKVCSNCIRALKSNLLAVVAD